MKVRLVKTNSKESADSIVQKLKAGKDFHQLERDLSHDKSTSATFTQWVRKGKNDLSIGHAEEISALLFGKKPDEIVRPVEAKGSWYIFRIEETKPGCMPSYYEEVREKVKQDYFFQKFQATTSSFFNRQLKVPMLSSISRRSTTPATANSDPV